MDLAVFVFNYFPKTQDFIILDYFQFQLYIHYNVSDTILLTMSISNFKTSIKESIKTFKESFNENSDHFSGRLHHFIQP